MSVQKPSVSKMVRAIQKLGLTVTGVEVAPDGTVKVLTSNDNTGADASDQAWDRYRARKADRTSQGDEAA
jgi:hypothetical protein